MKRLVGTQVAELWTRRSLILEPVEVLGIEDFGERGPVVCVWLKTQRAKATDPNS